MPTATNAHMRTTYARGIVASVRFDDGYVVTIFPNYAGWGEPESIEELRLTAPGQKIAGKYYSNYQIPQQTAGNVGFQHCEEGLGLPEVAAYFIAAYDFVAACHREDGRTNAAMMWNLTYLAHHDIDDLRTKFPQA